MTILLDTHEAVRKLTAAGADPKLAEALVDTFRDIDPELATKADLRSFRAEILGALNTQSVKFESALKEHAAEQRALISELRLEIVELEKRMANRLLACFISTVGIVVVLFAAQFLPFGN